MFLNIHEIPFTRAGSYLRIAGRAASGSQRLVIGTASKIQYVDLATRQNPTEYYEIALLRRGREVPYEVEATPSLLTLTTRDGSAARFALLDDETFVFEARGGITVRLLPCHSVCTLQWRAPDQCVMVDYRGLCQQMVRAGRATRLTVEDSPTVTGDTGPYHDMPRRLTFTGGERTAGAIRFSEHGALWCEPLPTVAAASAATSDAWEDWERRMPRVPAAYEAAARQAWLVLWGCQVAPRGLYRRRAMLMSKHWMNQVWSWDNCFNALAVARADEELALDQLRLFFDHQAPTGVLPEPLSDHVAHFGYVKPPIYGWTVLGLERQIGAKALRRHARELYEPIARQTEWWYAYHDSNRNGMCEYLHGNDSGWDNATAFDQGYPTEGADLAAHLVMQMEGLARLAELLRRPDEAAAWRKRAAKQLRLLLKRGVKNDRFFSPRNDAKVAEPCLSLLNYIPMVLGHRLPDAVRHALVRDLSPGGPFLTEWGLATESPQSAKYKPNGYWRGPVWAPSTYLIVDGLRDAGENGLAREIARRFCDMAARESSMGMWENYDALTGQGLCCPAYSWTAAVFVLLAEWLAEEQG